MTPPSRTFKSGQAGNTRELHDCRQHVLLHAIFDHHLRCPQRRCDERKGRTDEHIDPLEGLDKFRAQQGAIALRLQIVRRKQQFAYFKQGPDIVTVIIGTIAQCVLVVGAGLSRLDGELCRDISFDVLDGDIDQVRTELFKFAQGLLDRLFDFRLKMREEIAGDDAYP